jgi:tetratricopeptide (TPR) repeat protein
VQLLVATDQNHKAREAIDQARSKIPWPQAPLALAHCYEAVGDMDQAQQKYETALTTNPGNSVLTRQLADFYFRTHKPALAEPLVRRLLAGTGNTSAPDVAWARRMLAAILRTRGDFASLTEGLRLIEENLAANPSSIDDQRTKAYLLLADPRQAKSREAVQLLETVVGRGDQATLNDRFLLARLYLNQGEWSKYRAQMLGMLTSGNPEPEHIASYVRTLLQHNELSEGDLWLGHLEQAKPNEFGTVSLRFDLLLRRNQVRQAIDSLTAYLDKPVAEPKSRTDRLLLAANLLEGSAMRLTEARQTAGAAELNQKADAWYRSFVEQRPDQEMVLARFLGRQGQINESIDLVDRYRATTKPQDLAETALVIAGSGAAAPEQLRRLDNIIEAALKKLDRPASLLVALAQSYTRQERYQRAEQLYHEVIAKKPDTTTAMNNLGMLMALQGRNLDESLRLVDQAIRIAGPVPSMLDSRATVYIAMEQPDKALADLELAIADDATPVRLFHQARAYYLLGKKAEATAALGTAKKKNLKRSMLEPLERPAYDKLLEEL